LNKKKKKGRFGEGKFRVGLKHGQSGGAQGELPAEIRKKGSQDKSADRMTGAIPANTCAPRTSKSRTAK